MALSSDISDALGELLSEFGEVADGRTFALYGNTPGQVYNGDAVVDGGAGAFADVTGGYYDSSTYTAIVRKSDITFTPDPGMLVDARSKELRIADDGVIDNRSHYRLTLVSRDAPQR